MRSQAFNIKLFGNVVTIYKKFFNTEAQFRAFFSAAYYRGLINPTTGSLEPLVRRHALGFALQ